MNSSPMTSTPPHASLESWQNQPTPPAPLSHVLNPITMHSTVTASPSSIEGKHSYEAGSSVWRVFVNWTSLIGIAVSRASEPKHRNAKPRMATERRKELWCWCLGAV